MQTGNNNKYLRFWWEIAQNKESYESSKKWVVFAKGGPVNKWYGNLWLTVNTYDTNVSSPTKGYFNEGISFSGTGARSSFRYMPSGNIFDNDAPLIFPKGSYQNLDYCLAFLNSKLVSYIISCLNPTVKTQVGDVKRIPFVIPHKKSEKLISELSQVNINIKRSLTEKSLIDMNFIESPLVENFDLTDYLNLENHLVTQVLINEAVIDKAIFNIYSLKEEDEISVLDKTGGSIGSLPIINEARDAFINNAQENYPLAAIENYISSLDIINIDPEKLERIEKEFEGLYQNLNGIEEFCIRNNLNCVIKLCIWNTCLPP